MMAGNTRNGRRAVRGGFTLMEVMVVVAIILVLAGVGGVVYMRQLDDANRSRVKLDLKSLTTAVTTYKARYHQYPPRLDMLAVRQADGGAAYLEEDALRDPWGNPYIYEPTNLHPNSLKPHIYCQTPSGDAISNWDSMSAPQAGGIP